MYTVIADLIGCGLGNAICIGPLARDHIDYLRYLRQTNATQNFFANYPVSFRSRHCVRSEGRG